MTGSCAGRAPFSDLREYDWLMLLPLPNSWLRERTNLQLGHGAAETAQGPFDLAQVADFFAQLHRPRSELHLNTR